MTIHSCTVESALAVAVPIVVTYILNGETVQRTIGPLQGAPITINFDDGEDTTVFAPKAAQTGSISNTPPDLKTYRFLSWTLNGADPSYDQTRTEPLADSDVLTVNYEETTAHTTRTPQRRATKLLAKTDEEVAALRTTAMKPLQIKNQAITAYEQTTMEKRLGTYLCDQGIIGNDQHHYRNFAQEIWGLKRTFTSQTLTNEAITRAVKWNSRGYNWDTLKGTAQLQGIDIGASPPP